MFKHELDKLGLESFSELYELDYRLSKDGKLVSLKYKHLGVDFSNPIVAMSRGLILEVGSWKVVARPYEKFFTYPDERAAELDWASTVAYNKYDGSLAILYFYDGKWRVGSSGTPDGQWLVKDESATFEELFWQGMEPNAEQFDALFGDKAYTYLFEVTSPSQRIVHNYKGTTSTLHGIIETATGKDVSLEGNLLNKAHVIGRPSSMQKALTMLDVHKLEEGLVLRDDKGNRIKFKTEDYKRLHILAGSRKAMLAEVKASGGLLNDAELTFVWPEAISIAKNVEAYVSMYPALEQYVHGMTNKQIALDSKLTKQAKSLVFAIKAGKAKTPKQFVQTKMALTIFVELFDHD